MNQKQLYRLEGIYVKILQVNLNEILLVTNQKIVIIDLTTLKVTKTFKVPSFFKVIDCIIQEN